MAPRKKKVEEVKAEEVKAVEEVAEEAVKTEEVKEEVKAEEVTEEQPKKKSKKTASVSVKNDSKEQKPKYQIGSIVFVSKDADADLNGFKLFPQYKKYTYTVEAYDPESDVYTLRRLNLSLKLNGNLILAPNERAHDSLNRKQF